MPPYVDSSGGAHISLDVVDGVGWPFWLFVQTDQDCARLGVHWVKKGGLSIPFVSASITPDFSKYLRNSSFLESGVWRHSVDAVYGSGHTWYEVMLTRVKCATCSSGAEISERSALSRFESVVRTLTRVRRSHKLHQSCKTAKHSNGCAAGSASEPSAPLTAGVVRATMGNESSCRRSSASSAGDPRRMGAASIATVSPSPYGNDSPTSPEKCGNTLYGVADKRGGGILKQSRVERWHALVRPAHMDMDRFVRQHTRTCALI